MPAPWFLIAQAAQSLGRDDEAETALVQFLAAEPRHLAALLTMAAQGPTWRRPRGAIFLSYRAERRRASECDDRTSARANAEGG
jgi:hypothetical protein